jgi:hypothetical protein
MDKICIGIPAYGAQPPEWWGPLVKEAYNLSDFDIELESLLIQTTMSTDMNRNAIVNVFLDEKEADWLFWMDADNPLVRGGIRRLLDTKKKLVTGLYITKQGSPKPIAYTRTEEGRYANLPNWKRGELIPIDGAGLGCCLTHRSVYEDIRKNYVPLQRMAGGIAAIHKDDIIGDAFVSTISPEDNKVVDGIRKERMYEAKPDSKVPFFQLGLGRTEDFGFFEKAERLGYQLWLDTSIEVAHLSTKPSDPKEYFEWMDKQ